MGLFIYSRGRIGSAGSVQVIAQIKELADANSTASRIHIWQSANVWQKKTSYDYISSEWVPIRIHLINGMTYLIGMNGIVGYSSPKDAYSEEYIYGSEEECEESNHITDATVIGGVLVAVGMGRENFKRIRPGKWEVIDPDVRLKPGVIEVAGFNGVEGVSIDDFWTVGFKGEIYHFINGKARKEPSPTNATLHAIKVINANLAYACGQRGIILKWNGKGWASYLTDKEVGDLWSFAMLGDDLYTASDDMVYKITDAGLEPIGGRTIKSAGNLASNGSMILSSGPNQIAVTKDGKTWHDITQ